MKPFTLIAIVVFSLVSILHLARLILGWEILVNGVIIPLWLSGIGFIIAGGLAAMLWRETRLLSSIVR
jgi:multisubunit Na+/H+ antiporter MnhC subunit